MSQDIKVVMTSEDQGLLREFQREQREILNLVAGLGEMGQASRRANDEIGQSTRAAQAEFRRLERAAAQVFEKNQTPVERYNQELKQLRVLLRMGKIDEETLNRETQRQSQLMKEAGAAASGLGRELEQSLKSARTEFAKLQKTSEEAFEKTRTPLERYNQKMKELRVAHRMGKIDQETFNRETERQNKLLKETEGAADKAKNGINGAAAGFGQFAAQITGVGSAMGGIMLAARTVKAEYDELLRRQAEARGTAMDAAAAAHVAREAFSADATMGDKDIEPALEKLAKETRTKVGILGPALQTAFSARGSLSNADALEAVRQAARLTPNNQMAITTTAGRAMDIAKITGSNDMQANIGFLQNVQQSSRVTDLQKVGQTAVPAIQTMVSTGDTAEHAAELFATLTSLMADEQGDVSKTAAIGLAQQLNEFVAKRAAKDDRGKFNVPQDQIKAFDAAKGTTERLAVMQQSPELRRAFLAKASFEKQAATPIDLLLRGDERAMGEFKAAQANIQPLDQQQRALFEKKVGELESGKFQPIQTAEERSKANLEQHDLASEAEQRAGSARAILEETLQKLDLPGLDFLKRSILRGNFESRQFGEGLPPELAAAMTLRQIEREDFQDENGQDLQDAKSQRDLQTIRAQIQVLEEQYSAFSQNNPLAPLELATARTGIDFRRAGNVQQIQDAIQRGESPQSAAADAIAGTPLTSTAVGDIRELKELTREMVDLLRQQAKQPDKPQKVQVINQPPATETSRPPLVAGVGRGK